ncbi:hypothetical protein BKA70DRAFT_1558921 [Coprinopsis sp. MPI-PUGE-AT-0042]|nr:hypothetical protein BKA70DRAFT_1558921 [Coprinopsis sp. MPI-PUGE-AT-0042]
MKITGKGCNCWLLLMSETLQSFACFSSVTQSSTRRVFTMAWWSSTSRLRPVRHHAGMSQPGRFKVPISSIPHF